MGGSSSSAALSLSEYVGGSALCVNSGSFSETHFFGKFTGGEYFAIAIDAVGDDASDLIVAIIDCPVVQGGDDHGDSFG